MILEPFRSKPCLISAHTHVPAFVGDSGCLSSMWQAICLYQPRDCGQHQVVLSIPTYLGQPDVPEGSVT